MAEFIHLFAVSDMLPPSSHDMRMLLSEKEVEGWVQESEWDEDGWVKLDIFSRQDEYLMGVERLPVQAGNAVHLKIRELAGIIEHWQPRQAASWVRAYLEKVQAIYAFELFYKRRIYPPAYSVEDNIADNELVGTPLQAISKIVGGITKTDGEGFMNEAGDLVLVDPNCEIKTDWACALLTANGQWERFEVDFSDPEQLKGFLQGRRPRA